MYNIETLESIFIQAFDDKKQESRFYYEFLENNVYILGKSEEEDLLDEDNVLQVISVKQDEETFVPVFLSRQAMEKFLDGNPVPYIKDKGNVIIEALHLSDIVINPGQKDSMVFYQDELKEILSCSKN